MELFRRGAPLAIRVPRSSLLLARADLRAGIKVSWFAIAEGTGHAREEGVCACVNLQRFVSGHNFSRAEHRLIFIFIGVPRSSHLLARAGLLNSRLTRDLRF
jgi:hypothetical protein